ncbi:MAG: 50S ribosomal protein L15 [Patescibacteria group bacterium]|nr:50S ribosomal protein L15 [Patescibacteria group bacterium]MBU2509299.1 50S ribosomal protein L15 [Patescibacteria group bacterium]
MSLSLHTLKPAKGSKKKSRRIGRGYGSGRAKTSGRGTKGQKSRTGGKKGLKEKGLKHMVLGFPKQRGFTSNFPEVAAVRIGKVMEAFKQGEQIDIAGLKKNGLISKRAIIAKVVGGGEVDKKLNFVGIKVSASVKEAVEKAGGTFAADKKANEQKKNKANNLKSKK